LSAPFVEGRGKGEGRRGGGCVAGHGGGGRGLEV
jgi:hypothetical protein